MERDHPITADQRIAYVYNELKATSPYVRRSMLIYNCVPTNYTGHQEVRRVLWMTTSHPFFPVVYRLAEHKYSTSAIGTVHHAVLAGIPMCGVDSVLVDEVADLIWSRFRSDTERFPIYDEDGTKLGTVPRSARPAAGEIAVGDDEIPVEVAKDGDADPAPSGDTTILMTIPASASTGSQGILIGSDQHAHLYHSMAVAAASSISAPPPFDHPKKE
jgi:hypothetical protein